MVGHLKSYGDSELISRLMPCNCTIMPFIVNNYDARFGSSPISATKSVQSSMYVSLRFMSMNPLPLMSRCQGSIQMIKGAGQNRQHSFVVTCNLPMAYHNPEPLRTRVQPQARGCESRSVIGSSLGIPRKGERSEPGRTFPYPGLYVAYFCCHGVNFGTEKGSPGSQDQYVEYKMIE